MSTDARTWPDTPEAWKAALLDAEREMSNMAYEYNMLSSQSAREINALRAERDALLSDLKALLPLARFALYLIDTAAYDQYEDWIHQKAYALGLEEPGTTKDVPVVLAARAILSRETS